MAAAPSLRLRWIAPIAAVLCLGPAAVRADELVVPEAEAVVLDGVMNEDAWAGARKLSTPTFAAPVIPSLAEDETKAVVEIQPDLRVLASGGRLCFGLSCAEDPGSNIGLVLKITNAADDAKSAGDAVEIGYRPQSVRAPRYVARGPRGADRRAYRVEGGAACRARGSWSLELGIPLADLVDEDTRATLRVAALVFSRTPNVSAVSPEGALFSGPGAWHVLTAPAAGWDLAAEIDVERLQQEDERDLARRRAWIQYTGAVHELFTAGAPREETVLRVLVQEHLFEPLDAVIAARPDLTPTIEYLRGDVHRQLGDLDLATAAYQKAVDYAPGHREGWFGLHMVAGVAQLTEGDASTPSDYAAAHVRIDKRAEEAEGEPFAEHAVALARALLTYKQGELVKARPLLERIAAVHPHLRLAVTHYEECRDALPDWARERQQRKKDAEASLPRVAIKTNKGEFVVELFPSTAPNTVNNFVYLARAKFYDGLAFHHNMPFFLVQSGDPMSRDAKNAKLVGGGGPGYAIRTEPGGRRPFRGALVMANSGRDTEGSQFFVATGTAVHLADTYTVFGRVVEGMDVVDRLIAGDRIETVAPVRLTEGGTYHPITVAGEPAPEPTDTPPR